MAEMNEMNEMNEVNEVNIQDVVPVLTKPKRTQTPEMKAKIAATKKANKEKKMAKAKEEEEFDANTQNVLDLCNGMKSYLSLLYDGGKAEGTDDTYKEFDAFFAKKIKSITK